MRSIIAASPRHIWMPHWIAWVLQTAFLATVLLAGVCSAVTLCAPARVALDSG